jgi:hypothetical protein
MMPAMTELELCALLDAHDALVTACIDASLSFAEFLAAYGDFPITYHLDGSAAAAEERAVLRLFRKRIAFHFKVWDVLSGLRADDDANALQGEAARFVPLAGLSRLRLLVARYPDFKAEPGGRAPPQG